MWLLSTCELCAYAFVQVEANTKTKIKAKNDALVPLDLVRNINCFSAGISILLIAIAFLFSVSLHT